MSNPDEDAQDGRLSFFADPSNWPLFYHTAKNMKVRQLSGVAERKARHAVIPRLPIDFDQRYERRIPNELVVTPGPIADNSDLLRDSLSQEERERYRNRLDDATDGTLTFLNRSIDFGDEIDWNHELLEEYPLLWRLKLQSFEFLEWAVLGFDNPSEAGDIHDRFQRWLLSWAESNPIGDTKYLRRSWIPHSVSLRVLNWSRYAAWCEQADIPVDDRLYRQIFKNALFLENHIEFEVGGNHLIENAIALVMAGLLFEKHETGWKDIGLEVLEDAGETQFLADGGHFERSPMYHIMVVKRYITAINLLVNTDVDVPRRVRSTAEEGIAFLRGIQAPDDRIPLFNDAVYREVCSATTLLRYAESAMIDGIELENPEELRASGYYWLGSETARILIDAGPVGPPHLPAHSHNDLLSFNLWLAGRPIVVDTGTYEYAPTERRQYSRSVAAHNTVQFRNDEPIDIGGQYLMGKRTEPVVDISREPERDREVFRGRMQTESTLSTDYTHRRRIERQNKTWRVQDTVDKGPYTSRLHFHPDVIVDTTEEGHRVSIDNHVLSVTLETPSGTGQLRSSEYYPEFGRAESRSMLEFRADEGEPVCEYTIELKSGPGSAGLGIAKEESK